MSHHRQGHSSENLEPPASFADKAGILIAHWIKHNEDHAQTYRQWAHRFRENGLASAAALLESAADQTQQINRILSEAGPAVDSQHR